MRTALLATGLILAVLLALLCGNGGAAVAPLLLLAPFKLPSALVYLAGLVAGAALGAAGYAMLTAEPRIRTDSIVVALVPLVLVVATILLIVAVREDNASPLPAALGLILAFIALVAGLRCAQALREGEAIGFESHWGGLGGGSGGWRILPATALALLCLVFAGAAVALGIAADPGSGSNSSENVSANESVGNENVRAPVVGGVEPGDLNVASANEAGNAAEGNRGESAEGGDATSKAPDSTLRRQ